MTSKKNRISSEFAYTFTALRGEQAGQAYYVTMCPLKLIPKIFLFDEDEVPPELRAQRTLNRSRIPELSDYILDNPDNYIFSAITASVDGKVRFTSWDENPQMPDVGTLSIPMASRILINDGQHRRAAIEEALKAGAELNDETISVVFFVDNGLERSQQMFADLNKHAVRPSPSIGILYDHRDPQAQLTKNIVREVDVFKGMTEMEKSTLSNRSRRLFTLSSIHQATKRLLRHTNPDSTADEQQAFAIEFWNAVAQHFPDWLAAKAGKAAPSELRRDYIHSHGLALQALAIAGSSLIARSPRAWSKRLPKLKGIDWSRANSTLWEGRALVNGRVSKASKNVTLTANAVKQALGVPLSPEEDALEQEFLSMRRG